MFGLELFPSLSASMKMPMGAGRVVAHSYMAFALALGLFGLNWWEVGKVLT